MKNWPEDKLKELLEEARNFKGRGDLAHTSEKFKVSL